MVIHGPRLAGPCGDRRGCAPPRAADPPPSRCGVSAAQLLPLAVAARSGCDVPPPTAVGRGRARRGLWHRARGAPGAPPLHTAPPRRVTPLRPAAEQTRRRLPLRAVRAARRGRNATPANHRALGCGVAPRRRFLPLGSMRCCFLLGHLRGTAQSTGNTVITYPPPRARDNQAAVTASNAAMTRSERQNRSSARRVAYTATKLHARRHNNHPCQRGAKQAHLTLPAVHPRGVHAATLYTSSSQR